MKNIIILGCGRSGTSALAGGLEAAGFHQGNNHFPPDASNPGGYFEDQQLVHLNEDLLKASMPSAFETAALESESSNGQRWLVALKHDAELVVSEPARQRIAEFIKHEPFCYKDPRFSYTLRAWAPWLEQTLRLVMFRDPIETANSMVTMCQMMPHLRRLNFDFRSALAVWQCMYEHIFAVYSKEPIKNWMFIHRSQLLDESTLKKLELRTSANFDRSRICTQYFRSVSTIPIGVSIPENIWELYAQLCSKAEFSQTSWATPSAVPAVVS